MERGRRGRRGWEAQVRVMLWWRQCQLDKGALWRVRLTMTPIAAPALYLLPPPTAANKVHVFEDHTHTLHASTAKLCVVCCTEHRRFNQLYQSSQHWLGLSLARSSATRVLIVRGTPLSN